MQQSNTMTKVHLHLENRERIVIPASAISKIWIGDTSSFAYTSSEYSYTMRIEHTTERFGFHLHTLDGVVSDFYYIENNDDPSSSMERYIDNRLFQGRGDVCSIELFYDDDHSDSYCITWFDEPNEYYHSRQYGTVETKGKKTTYTFVQKGK